MPIVAGEQGGGSEQTSMPKPRRQGPTAKVLPGGRQSNSGYGLGPVAVYADADVNMDVLKRALKNWNAAVGYPLFGVTSQRDKADVVVRMWDRTAGDERGGFAVPGRWTDSGKGQVRIARDQLPMDLSWMDPLSPAQKRATLDAYASLIEHELGHTIGLAHPGPENDPYTVNGGIMGDMSQITQQEVNTTQYERNATLQSYLRTQQEKLR